jgi:prepilin-type N-terminal cleavage/methylation domain-containing protein
MKTKRNRAFSLLELVIVVVIIGIIAAIAIPRMSRGSAGAANSALSGNLAVLRGAIELFAAEHGGAFPKLATIEDQLTKYTDSSNTTAAVDAKDKDHPFGPYLRAVPPLPVGANKGNTTFTDTMGAAGFGWVYDEGTGEVRANCADAELDDTDTKYNLY